MTLGISAMDLNTSRYIQSIQAADGLSNADVSSLFNQSVFGGNGFGSSLSFGNNAFGFSTVPFGGYNATQALEYQQQMIDNNLAISQKSKVANLLSTLNEDLVSTQISRLQRYIKNNRQESVLREYSKLENAVRQLYSSAGYNNITDEQVKATADKLYLQATGNYIVDDIRAHGDNSFVQGFKTVTSFGLVTSRSADDNISKISGDNTRDALNKTEKIAGGVTGATTMLAGSLLLGKGLVDLAKSNIGQKVGNALMKLLLKK